VRKDISLFNMKFIVRVYGIYIDEVKGLLVSDELIKGKKVTKFPGGGLEYGESTIDCLVREMKEETGIVFEVLSHFYTTDFFVESAYDPGYQVISIYYTMKPVSDFSKLELNKENPLNHQLFRFIPINNLKAKDFSLAIDKHVAGLIKKQ
jgi:8-oxo-dGTP diphosphatase